MRNLKRSLYIDLLKELDFKYLDFLYTQIDCFLVVIVSLIPVNCIATQSVVYQCAIHIYLYNNFMHSDVL